MKRLLSVLTILFTASCSNQANLNITDVPQIQENASISSNKDKVAYYSRGAIETTINKEPAIKKLTGNKITISKTSLLEPTNELYEIRFTNSRPLDVIGELVMYLDKSGNSKLAVTENYCNNIPAKLTFEETKKLLRTASNYKENVNKLGKLFGN
ncbi:MAG: hypothetical protein U0354_07340 [Candidatus Sericytochromatia bacterium]